MPAMFGLRNQKAAFRLVFTVLLSMGMAYSLSACNKRESSGGKVAPKTFASPAAAGQALFEAAKTGNQNQLMAIFGSDGKDLIFSGDAVKDKNTAQRFVDAYQQMNRWSKSQSGEEILFIGADNFVFPIPLDRNASGQWAFNTTAGKNEVLARRIGDGELTSLGILSEIVDAQQQYFAHNHQFAQKFVSDEGQHNGLYWPVAEGQPLSPLADLVDVAKALGYSHTDTPQPFNGYYYRILTKQGSSAKNGAKDYLVDGNLKDGFAILAWPAKYRDSGIMTFIVGEDGVIYEKDLGENTADLAAAITSYDPTKEWGVVLKPEPADQTASAPGGQ